MEAPLDQEAATADLITDVVAPSQERSADVCGLARDLASGSAAWRDAWSFRSADGQAIDGVSLTSPPLSRADDDELRRLSYRAEFSALTGASAERLVELRLRDRRSEVRPPRGFVVEDDVRPRRRWLRFIGR